MKTTKKLERGGGRVKHGGTEKVSARRVVLPEYELLNTAAV